MPSKVLKPTAIAETTMIKMTEFSKSGLVLIVQKVCLNLFSSVLAMVALIGTTFYLDLIYVSIILQGKCLILKVTKANLVSYYLGRSLMTPYFFLRVGVA